MANQTSYTQFHQQRRPGDPSQGIKGRRAILLGDEFESRKTAEVVATAIKREVLRHYESKKLIHWWDEDLKPFRFRFKIDMALDLSTHDLKSKLSPVVSMYGLKLETDFLADPFRFSVYGQLQHRLLRTWMIRFIHLPKNTMAKLRSIFIHRGVNDWNLWELAPGFMQAGGLEMIIPIIWHGPNNVSAITKTLSDICKNSRASVQYVPNLSDDFEGTLTFSSPANAQTLIRGLNKEGIKFRRTLIGSPRMHLIRQLGLAPENDKTKVDWAAQDLAAHELLDG